MTTLISKITSPFCHEWKRIKVSSRNLIGRASISIIIIFSLRIRSHWRRWRKSLRSEATYDRLPPCNTTDTNVHLIQLCRECIKASIHTLKLHHDVSKGHIIRRRGRSKCGWSRSRWRRTGGKSCWPRLPQPNCTSLRLTIATAMAYMKVKWSDTRKGTEERRMILVITEGKMSLSRDAKSL